MLSKVLSKLVPPYKPNSSEDLLRDIVTASLPHRSTRITRCLQTDSFYVTNSELEYYIKLNKVSITISNHSYTYREGLTEPFCKILYKMIEAHLEARIAMFENEVFKNQTDLLNKIKIDLLNSSNIEKS